MIAEPPIGALTAMKIVRRGICPCGFGVVKDDVPLGNVYQVEKWTILRNYIFQCGWLR